MGETHNSKFSGKQIQHIYKITEKINSTHDLDIVARDIVTIMTDALDCIGGALLIVDENEQVLRALDYSRTKSYVEKVIPLLPKAFQDYTFDLKEPQNYTARTVVEKKMFIGSNYEEFMAPVVSKFTARAIQKVTRMKTAVTVPTIVTGKVVGVLMVGFREEELSEEKKELLKLFSSQCAIAVNNAQKYKGLQSQYEKMQEILAQQSDFIATSSHEFRTPLSAALFQAQDLVESIKNNNLPELEEEAELVVESLERLQNITEKIFAVQAYDANKTELYFIPVNLADFCAVIYYKFNALMKKRGLKWEVENSFPKKFIFMFDAQHIEKMLNELISNAANFTSKNGKVTLKVYDDNDELYFEVIDTGEGIPKAERKNIFKKFKGNHSMQSMGIGLGLYIVNKVVTLHNGEVWAEETPGGGATFVVKLPEYKK